MHSWKASGLLVLGLALLGSSTVTAQTRSEPSPVKFGIGGGLAVPLGTFDDNDKLGWQGQALITFRPSGSPVGFRVDGNYMQMKWEPGYSAFIGGASAGAGKTQVIAGSANIVFTFPTSEETRFKPYILGGAGVYNIRENPDATGVPTGSVTKFGINGGAGFDIGAGGAVLFVEGRFHNVFSGTINNIGGTSSASLIPITVGIKFGGQ
jgi:hypothetical protein